jgi:hypothetical protein
MLRIEGAILMVAICLAPGAEAAVFKCRNAAGAVIYSQEPCEKEGAKQEKKLTRQDLKANEMRMRSRPPSGATPSYSQGSNYQGAAPDKKPSGNDRD